MKRASFILSLLVLCIGLPLHGSGMTVNMNDTTVLVYNYTYDEWGRPLTTTLSVNNAEPVTIASNTYDELGRLASTSRNNQASLTTEYDYNIRDWVTEINTPAFTENLYYNTSLNGSTPQWSGNISAMAWKAGSDFQNNKLRSYNYTYDGMNRLTAANYWENAVPKGRYSTAYSYDAMSNILSLQRMGRTDDNCFGPIDRLRYEYEGNQLIMVRDSNLWEPTYAHAMHFNDGYNGQVEYEYNANGAMTVDRNKGITIQYNRLNLPQRINYDTGHYTEYTYCADGRKLRTTYYPNMVLQPQLIGYDEFGMPIFGPPPAPTPELTRDYCGPFIYENGTLQRILFDGGYITFDEANNNTPEYHFYTKDHLGHVRLVQAADGAIEETNHYYPYGTMFGESTGLANSTQPYKYTGKELDRMHGLDLHDHGARWSDTNLARWPVIDPLAEDYKWMSPYVLCADNPMKYVDLDGQNPIYDTQGYFLGTDNTGLQGYYFVMDKKHFTQGMSNIEAGNHAILGTIPSDVESRINDHYTNLPNRPDYDGFVTVSEGISWAKSHPNALKHPTPDNMLYIDASRLDFGALSTSDFPRVGIKKDQNLFNNANILESAINPTLLATVYALGRVNMILTDRNRGTIKIVNDEATDYDWNVGGGTMRNTFIQINNTLFGINPQMHGFKTFYYGIGTLRK